MANIHGVIVLSAILLLSGQASPPPARPDPQPGRNQAPAEVANPSAIQPTAERQTSSQNHYEQGRREPPWWGPETAPEWFQVILTVLAGLIAWLAFSAERRTVRLTQRADVLLDTISLTPYPKPFYLSPLTKIVLTFKNYGPTRASDVFMMGDMEMGDAKQLEGWTRSELSAGVIAAGHDQRFAFEALGLIYPAENISEASKGNELFAWEVTVRYTDVFGQKHRTFSRGVYHDGTFRMDRQEAD